MNEHIRHEIKKNFAGHLNDKARNSKSLDTASVRETNDTRDSSTPVKKEVERTHPQRATTELFPLPYSRLIEFLSRKKNHRRVR